MTVAGRALGAAATIAVTSDDITGALVGILQGCQVAVHAQTTAVLVRTRHGVDVLSATSHEASQLELDQVQKDEGPCLDVIASGGTVSASGARLLRHRWPRAGPAMTDAGFSAVLAVPARWQGAVFGSLNVFFHAENDELDDLVPIVQLFADLATLALVASRHASTVAAPLVLRDNVGDALQGRADIERAKGVLAHRHGITLAEAYRRLLDLVALSDRSLTAVARQVQEDAVRRPPGA